MVPKSPDFASRSQIFILPSDAARKRGHIGFSHCCPLYRHTQCIMCTKSISGSVVPLAMFPLKSYFEEASKSCFGSPAKKVPVLPPNRYPLPWGSPDATKPPISLNFLMQEHIPPDCNFWNRLWLSGSWNCLMFFSFSLFYWTTCSKGLS